MEVNENRGRLCRKKLQGKIRKKKNHQKEKDITGSVKRANHNKGSMIVSDPTELVQPGGNNHSSRFVRLCVGASDFVQYDFAKETSSSVALEDIVMPLNFECL